MEQVILDAAEKQFLEKGFAMASMTEIAKQAGCNQALVHYYFRTKEKLFNSIFENLANLFISQFMKSSEEDIPFLEKLRKKIEAHFELLQAHPKLPFLLFNELTTNPKRANAIKTALSYIPKSIFAKMQEELDAEIKKGNVKSITVYDLAFTVVSLNVVLFLAKPVFEEVFDFTPEEYQNFVEHRKSENVRIILESLKPETKEKKGKKN